MRDPVHDKKTRLTEITNRVAGYFSERPEVAAVYLFGSLPVLKDTHASDIDIAVLTTPPAAVPGYRLKKEYCIDLAGLLKREIDIVLLNKAGELLTYQILKHGRLVLEKDPTCHALFRSRRLVDYLDFKYHENIMQKGMIRLMKEERHG